jgi:NAD(P)-dependent dehydrogenase (short-subunit alcohol dehydrogenase family)
MNTPEVEHELQGRVAFVMGGSSGIGMACADLLARRGASVSIFGHLPDTLDHAARLQDRGLTVQGFVGDGAASRDVRTAIDDTVWQFGGLDILINSAAIHPLGDVVETDEATWDRTMAVNVKSYYLTCHFGVPHLIARGGGSIVNISSVQATSCTSSVCAYATSKAAILGFTRTLAVDLGKHGIHANAICPGSINTPMQERFARENAAGRSLEEMYRLLAQPVPLGRIGEAWEIAELAAFLAGPRSTFCNGADFTADGGLLAGLRLV